jgi:hypothetical protein
MSLRGIKIISDGLGHNTKIVDATTGEVLSGLMKHVTAVKWQCGPGGFAEATVELELVSVDVVANFSDSFISQRIADLQALLNARAPQPAAPAEG